jgi:hypothetical protein
MMEPVPDWTPLFLVCSAAFGGIAWVASRSRRERWRFLSKFRKPKSK